MSQNLHPALPAHEESGSLAPIDVNNPPELQLQELAERRRLNEIPLIEYLNNTLDAIDKIDAEELLEIRKVMIKSHKYYDGKQYGHVDRNCVWHDARANADDIAFVDNQYKYHVDTALMEITRADISLEVKATDETDTELIEAAKVAQSRINSNRERVVTPRLRQTDGMNLLLKTVAIHYDCWDGNGGRKENSPDISKQDVEPSPAATVCAICKYPMEPPATDGIATIADQRCPHCGSSRTETLEAPRMSGLVTRYRKVPIGQTRTYSVDPLQVTVHLGARTIPESPYLKWKQLMMRSILEDRFKDRVIPSTGVQSIELQYQRNIERSVDGSGIGNDIWAGDTDVALRKGGEQFELLECEQTWLDPHLYSRYRPDEAQTLFNGLILKRGESLLTLFPNGMYVCRVGKVILDLWPESKNLKWSSSPFGLRPGGFYGSGTSALHNDQDVINMIRSLAVANANANAVPREFVNTTYLEGNRLSNDPNEVTEITALPEGATISNNVYFQATAQPLSSDAYGLSEDAKNAMQTKLGTFSASTAAPDLKQALNTARGMEIFRDMAVGRMGPAMMLLATELDVEQAYHFLEMENAHPHMSRYKLATARAVDRPQRSYGNLSYNLIGVKALLRADIRNDFLITPTKGSWMPVTRSQQISNLQEFVPFLQLPEEIQALAADAFAIPLQIGSWSAEQREAQRRLKVFAAISEFLEKELPAEGRDQQALICAHCEEPIDETLPAGTPCQNCGAAETEMVYVAAEVVLTQSNMPVDMVMDKHQAFIDFYNDWYVSDEGVESSDLLKRVIQRRTKQHYQARTEYEKWLQRLTLEVQAPSAMASLVTSGAASEQDQALAAKAQDANDLRELQKAALLEQTGALPATAPGSNGGGLSPRPQPPAQSGAPA